MHSYLRADHKSFYVVVDAVVDGLVGCLEEDNEVLR